MNSKINTSKANNSNVSTYRKFNLSSVNTNNTFKNVLRGADATVNIYLLFK